MCWYYFMITSPIELSQDHLGGPMTGLLKFSFTQHGLICYWLRRLVSRCWWLKNSTVLMSAESNCFLQFNNHCSNSTTKSIIMNFITGDKMSQTGLIPVCPHLLILPLCLVTIMTIASKWSFERLLNYFDYSYYWANILDALAETMDRKSYAATTASICFHNLKIQLFFYILSSNTKVPWCHHPPTL